MRSSQGAKARFRFVGFLIRMFVASGPCRGPFFIRFIRHVAGCAVDTNNSNCDGLRILRLELCHLAAKVVYHSVDLADHRLLNDFHFYANFDGRNRSSLYDVPRVGDWLNVRDDFTEASIAATRLNAMLAILNVENGNALAYAGDVFRGRIGKVVQVLEKLNRYKVALIRCAVAKDLPIKELTKFVEQPVWQVRPRSVSCEVC